MIKNINNLKIRWIAGLFLTFLASFIDIHIGKAAYIYSELICYIGSMLLIVAFTDLCNIFLKTHSNFIWCMVLMALNVIPSILLFILMDKESIAVLQLITSIVLFVITICKKESLKPKTRCITIAAGAFASIGYFVLFFLLIPYNELKLKAFLSRNALLSIHENWELLHITKQISSLKFIGKSNIEFILPGATSKYVLLNIASEYGTLAALLLIVVIATLITILFLNISKISKSCDYYVPLAATIYITVQFLINILISISLFPPCNIYMPFISCNTTSIAINCSLLSVILSTISKGKQTSAKA